ncbi:MAG: SUMF1/EgtB/PvdO family nonheme iron enzyme [Kiritimatiellae bacterium]|nr:SUMF1/EgtB/PvdO family nonheme iron enzyme [Kiritimatiellia bacterium]
MNLILPAEEVEGPYPLLVHVHGGGFMGGTPNINVHDPRRSFSESFRYVLDHGVAVASVGYRLARESGWPAPVSDPLCGIRFLQQNGAHWNVMTERVMLAGHSAGARSIGLIGMVPQDSLHTQGLPWGETRVNVAGTFLWAGALNTRPMLEAFGEFGKPRWFSVPALHHGPHPAWNDGTRHSLRIRNNFPHVSNRMPPLYMVRGDRDYGGDHRDAEASVALWRALGIEAELSVVEGGHSAAGPPEALLRFVRRHVVEAPFDAPEHDPEFTAGVLLGLGEAFGALEVLTAAHTVGGGADPGPGEWLFLVQDGSMLWLPEDAAWPEAHRDLSRRAREVLAEREGEAARAFAERSDWFRAAEAARTVRKLIGRSATMAELLDEIEAREREEAEFFKTLYRANTLWRSGEKGAAQRVLQEGGAQESGMFLTRGQKAFAPPLPGWADAHGVDLYGPWVAIALQEGVEIRLRRTEPGTWALPEHLQYQPRGRVEDDPVTRVEVAEGFWVAETPVTRAQWAAVQSGEAAALPSGTADLPVTRRDYLQIIEWLETLSARHEDLLARLPTEPEWLHFATGGGRGSAVRGGTDLHAVHALRVNPDSPEANSVYGVIPDAAGLYGVLGGVLEWTASGDRREARFQENGRMRVFRYPMSRGGAWSSLPHVLGLETREWHRHGNRQSDLGFRLIIGGAEADSWLEDVILR